MNRAVRARAVLLLLALGTAGCGQVTSAVSVAGGDPSQGARLITAYGCGSCHTISGIAGADGEVGPSLSHLAERRVIAGRLANTPDNLIRWIEGPQEIDPGNVMPDLGVGPTEARDIASYLDRH